MINGRFLAEITRDVINRLEANKYEFVEWRVSIYGKLTIFPFVLFASQ